MRHPLGTREFAVLAAGLLLIGIAGGYSLLPGLWAEYDARVTLPRYHARYGFESALVPMPVGPRAAPTSSSSSLRSHLAVRLIRLVFVQVMYR
jgi:hypothetical protein